MKVLVRKVIDQSVVLKFSGHEEAGGVCLEACRRWVQAVLGYGLIVNGKRKKRKFRAGKTFYYIMDPETIDELQSPVHMFNGASQLQGLQDYIAKDASYRRENPGKPIAYTIAFLKDNSFARMGSSTDYTETECVRYNNGFVRFVHEGAYVAKFQVTWTGNDLNGNLANTQWDSGEKTAGYSYQVDLPGDAQAVRIKAWAATGLVWDPWGEIMNIALAGPDNKTYRVRGTTLNRSWDNG